MLRRYKYFIIPPALILFFSISYFLYINMTNNFHPITVGEAYRSAQPGIDNLEYYIKEHGIRSILNLRGKFLDEQWYINEINVSENHNVKHYDLALSSGREPTNDEVRKLIEIFKIAPRPILIHCMGGADRTGLVSAMWKVIVNKEQKSEAGKQLSLWFGHIPVGETYAMNRFFHNWKPESHFTEN